MNKYFTTQDLEDRLRNRFCPPAYAFIPQVRNGTGYSNVEGNQRRHGTRTADAIAMSLWPSRGLHLNGFEIKVYRNDWVKELNDPAKAEEIAQFCDFWWIVAPKEIIKIEEVPQHWGLLNPFGKTLKAAKGAEQLKPVPVDKLFLAAILRRAQESIAPEAKIIEAAKEGQVAGGKRAEESFGYERKEHRNLKDRVAGFEKASGININQSWQSGENIGDAVRQVLNGEHAMIERRLKGLLETAERIVTGIKKELGDE